MFGHNPAAPPAGFAPPAQQGFAPPQAPSQALTQAPPQGFAPPQAPPQGFAPPQAPPQGFAPPQQGFAPPQQGFAPSQQGYRAPGYAPPGYAPPAAPPAARGESKYAGIVAGGARAPMLSVGTYRVRVLTCEEGWNPGTRRESYKVGLQVLEAAPGSETAPSPAPVTMIANTSVTAGLSELKRFSMACAGFGPSLAEVSAGNSRARQKADEDAYDALEMTYGGLGRILDSSAGKPNGAPSIVGRIVDVIVTRGKDVPPKAGGAPTGDYFRQYVWAVVPENEQK